MTERQIAADFFAPWIEPYLKAPDQATRMPPILPGTETYLPRHPIAFPATPFSWLAAMGSRAWAPPIFANQSWPAALNLEGTGEPFPEAGQGAESASPAPPDHSTPPSTGILPPTMAAGPEVPISGLSSADGHPIYPSQLSAAPAPPRSWGRRLGDALSEENVRYYLGPGLYDFYRKFADLGRFISPVPGVEQGLTDASNANKALSQGDYGQAALDYGKSTFNLGTSIIPDLGPAVGKAAALGAKALASGSKALFAGMFAKTAQLDRLAAAKVMEHAGAPREEILPATGWFRDPIDGKWKFEISDEKMRFTDTEGWGVGGRFSSVQHPDAKKAYPNLRHVHLDYKPGPATEAEYWTLNPGGRPTEAKPTDIRIVAPLSERHGATIHELQHAIQEIENFARGGLPINAYDPAILERAKPLLQRADELRRQGRFDQAAVLDRRVANIVASSLGYENYWRLAGEIEARNAQRRALWTPEKRLLIPPWETLDIGAMRPIVRFHVPPPFPERLDPDSFRELTIALRKLGLL